MGLLDIIPMKKKDAVREDREEKPKASAKAEKPAKPAPVAAAAPGDLMAVLSHPMFQIKLVLLLVALASVAFSAVVLTKTNLHLMDAFELQNLSYHITKLYSPMFVLFMGLLGVGLGLAAYAGYKAHWLLSVVAVVLSLALWQGLALWMPGVTLVFLGLALSFACATVLASLTEKLSLGASWTTVGRALLLFALFSGWFVYSQVSTEKDRYFDLMLSGAVALGTGGDMLSAASLQPVLDGALSNVQFDEAFFRSMLSEQDVRGMEPALLDTCRQMGRTLLTGSSACQTTFDTNYAATMVALQNDHTISSLMYNQTIASLVAQGPSMKQRMSAQASSTLQAAMTQARSSASSIDPAVLRAQMLSAIPAMKMAYDQFPLAVAGAFATILYTLSMLPRLVGALVAWTMNKLIG